MRGDVAQIRTLAENRVDLNYADSVGQTALPSPRSTAIDRKTNLDETALVAASQNGHTDVVKVCLKRGRMRTT